MTTPTIDTIELVSVIIVIGMLILVLQRYFANKRLVNRRRNPD